jgi:uncharacterized protein
MTNVQSSGIDPGQRRLNGPQTTGREYRNLSQPTHAMAQDDDVAIPMRDGVMLLADVHRPAESGRYPVLVAASPYPRQIQNLGVPAGFIEAGASDFFVPRGYVHVIANCRGTSGSGGTFGFFDGQERRDTYDLVEWAAQQPWSNGNVGMIGIIILPEHRWKLRWSGLPILKPSCLSRVHSTFMSQRRIMG